MLELRYDNSLLSSTRYYLAEAGSDPMQVVPEPIRKSVVFLAYRTDDGDSLAGTGFFISVPLENPLKQMVYLVTAKHVIEGIKSKTSDNNVYVRINKKDDNSALNVVSEISHWQYHPTDNSVDVAVLRWAPDPEVFDYKNIPVVSAVTDEIIRENKIGAGDEIFMTGLFSQHFGNTKNLPIIRTGNIALMPDEKVNTRDLGDIDAYLVEARSIGGLSGSPVFVYLGFLRSNPEDNSIDIKIGEPKKGLLFAWLGLMHGHWDINENHVDSVGANNVNMGIGIVVPATKIMEVINSEEFVKERKDAEEADKKANAPTPDIVGEVTEEQFKGTLKKVSRKTNSSQGAGLSGLYHHGCPGSSGSHR